MDGRILTVCESCVNVTIYSIVWLSDFDCAMCLCLWHTKDNKCTVMTMIISACGSNVSVQPSRGSITVTRYCAIWSPGDDRQRATDSKEQCSSRDTGSKSSFWCQAAPSFHQLYWLPLCHRVLCKTAVLSWRERLTRPVVWPIAQSTLLNTLLLVQHYPLLFD